MVKIQKGIIVAFLAFFVLMTLIITFSSDAMAINVYSFSLGNHRHMKIKESIKQLEIRKKEATNDIKGIKEKDAAYQVASFIMPVKGGVTTSAFGDMVGRNSVHKGHDWAVDIGTKVVASENGYVEKSYFSDSYGYNILLRHDGEIETRYAHLSCLYVCEGQYVKQGQVIGLSGNTGDSTGPHIHFEYIIDGQKVNPLKYIHYR